MAAALICGGLAACAEREEDDSSGADAHTADIPRSPLAMLRSPFVQQQQQPQTPAGESAETPIVRKKSSVAVALTPSRYAGYSGDAYEQKEIIGRGAFGLVTLMIARDSGKRVAMKTIDRFRLASAQLKKAVAREIELMQSTIPPHAGIVPLLALIETPRSIHMVLEYASGGTLHGLLNDGGALDEPKARGFARQLVAAVAHLHAHRVCHRDLKLENCVLDKPAADTPVQRVRLIDFGLSFRWPAGGAAAGLAHKPLTKLAGSLHYMAPEMLARTGYVGAYVDAWSLGVIIAAMLGGRLPFRGETDSAIKKAVLKGAYTLPAFRPPITAEAAELVARFLTLAPEERLTVCDAHAHPWLAAGQSGA